MISWESFRRMFVNKKSKAITRSSLYVRSAASMPVSPVIAHIESAITAFFLVSYYASLFLVYIYVKNSKIL